MKIKQIQNNPFQENTYVVYDEVSMEAAIVDCGALFPQEEERIEAFVNDNNLKVKYILNTHLHLDHCFGNHWAAGRYGVLPMAHADDETLLARMGEQARMFGLPFEVKTEVKLSNIEENEFSSLLQKAIDSYDNGDFNGSINLLNKVLAQGTVLNVPVKITSLTLSFLQANTANIPMV